MYMFIIIITQVLFILHWAAEAEEEPEARVGTRGVLRPGEEGQQGAACPPGRARITILLDPRGAGDAGAAQREGCFRVCCCSPFRLSLSAARAVCTRRIRCTRRKAAIAMA